MVESLSEEKFHNRDFPERSQAQPEQPLIDKYITWQLFVNRNSKDIYSSELQVADKQVADKILLRIKVNTFLHWWFG